MNHCKDCCCAQAWKALGVTDYTGLSIVEHINQLRATVEAVTSARDENYRLMTDAEQRCAKAERERDELAQWKRTLLETAECSEDRVMQLAQDVAGAEAEVERLQAVEMRYRRLLWLSHGHTGLYGDDGEMQCGKCRPFYDYKRHPLEDLERMVNDAKWAQVLASVRPADGSKETK